MARKSNKTAHVLNLLSGQQDSAGESEKETLQPQKTTTEAATTTAKAEEAAEKAAPAPVEVQPVPVPEVPSNISIIDNGAKEDDPVAERIHDELLKELEKEVGIESVPEVEAPKMEATDASAVEAPKAETATAPVTEAPKVETTTAPVTEPLKTEPISTPVVNTHGAEEVSKPAPVTPNVEATSVPVMEAPKTEAVVPPTPESPKAEAPAPTQPEPPEPEEEILELAPEPPVEPEPPKEPEPDYVMLNVMQRIVEDKIIYFMKQFDVCTCPRCKADTIALTLSGLPAKYKIVDKFAVDPLVSYYTSRLISQVTVEALKACTQVKDNPRH